MLITHLGSDIWSYIVLIAGAIFHVTVPATIIKSACLGDAENLSAPNLARSNLEAAEAMESISEKVSESSSEEISDEKEGIVSAQEDSEKSIDYESMTVPQLKELLK